MNDLDRLELDRLEYLAYHDPLTGLYNRNYLYDNISNISELSGSYFQGGYFYEYVYFIDLNDLHEINKKGHTEGDKHIVFCVKEIKKKIEMKNCLFIRYAGDEFIIFSKNDELLVSTNLYTVGKSKIISYDIEKSINNADVDMIKNKISR
jgi:diguanylate cyclase (GGDEF)-like protein